jgi:hypothetical protein
MPPPPPLWKPTTMPPGSHAEMEMEAPLPLTEVSAGEPLPPVPPMTTAEKLQPEAGVR